MAGTKNTHPHPPRRRATRTDGTYPITRAGCGS
jgi:hypothetical protein